MKICHTCHRELPLTEFYSDKKAKDGLRHKCKQCGKQYNLLWSKENPDKVKAKGKRCKDKYGRYYNMKSKYGLSRDQLDALGTECMICGRSDDLCIDHCHTTLQVRGLLCRSCNGGLGLFRDNSRVLIKAANYITSHQTSQYLLQE